jgi:signal recognition particle receptor subunit alpha
MQSQYLWNSSSSEDFVFLYGEESRHRLYRHKNDQGRLIARCEMLDEVAVFTRGGVVLWSRKLVSALSDDPVRRLVSEVLLLDKAGESSFHVNEYTLKWSFANELNLVFVVVYLNFSSVFPVDALLDEFKNSFVSMFADLLKVVGTCSVPKLGSKFDFDGKFLAIEQKFVKMIRDKSVAPVSAGKVPEKKDKNVRVGSSTNDESSEPLIAESLEEDDSEASPDTLTAAEKLKLLKKKGTKPQKKSTKKQSYAKETVKPVKKTRKWGPDGSSLDAPSEPLDFARGKPSYPEQDEPGPVEIVKAPSEDEESEVEVDGKSSSSGKSFMSSMFSRFTEGRELSKDDLDKVVESFKEKLLSKNVASDVTDHLTKSVTESLIGKKISSFSSVKSVMRSATEEALTRVLTAKQEVDILRDIDRVRAEGRVFTIVFVGVNGVGKV